MLGLVERKGAHSRTKLLVLGVCVGGCPERERKRKKEREGGGEGEGRRERKRKSFQIKHSLMVTLYLSPAS